MAFLLNRRRFLLSAAVVASGGHYARSVLASAWQSAASLPIQTQELYPAVHNGKLFVAGGIAKKLGVPYFSSAVFSYDPTLDQWQDEHDLPEALHHPALVSLNGTLYAIGGFHGTYRKIWQMRDTVYALREDRWELVANLPYRQAEGVSAAIDQQIHIVTGQSPMADANEARSDHSEINSHLVWLPNEQQFEYLRPIPTPRNSATGGFIGQQLIVCGGRTAKGNLATVEIYDLTTDTWRSAAPLPSPQAGTASVIVDNGIIVMGGEIFTPSSRVFPNVWRYSLSKDEWSALPDMQTPRHGIGAGRFGDRVYVVGGATEPGGNGTSDANEFLDLSAL